MDITQLDPCSRTYNPAFHAAQRPLPTIDAEINSKGSLLAELGNIDGRLAAVKAKVASLQESVRKLSTSPGYVSSLTDAQRRAKPTELTDALLEQQRIQDERDAFAAEHGDLASQIAGLRAEKQNAERATDFSTGVAAFAELVSVAESLKAARIKCGDIWDASRKKWPANPPLPRIYIPFFDEPGDANSFDSLKVSLISVDPSIVPADDEAHAKLARIKAQEAERRAALGLR